MKEEPRPAEIIEMSKGLTMQEASAYWNLQLACWHAGKIPSDPAGQASAARMPPAKWEKVKEKVLLRFNADGTTKPVIRPRWLRNDPQGGRP